MPLTFCIPHGLARSRSQLLRFYFINQASVSGIKTRPESGHALYSYRCGSLPLKDGQFSKKSCKLGAMTTSQIKSEIQKALDNIPENALWGILEYLKELEGKTENQIKLAKDLRDIVNEDKELLERLAK